MTPREAVIEHARLCRLALSRGEDRPTYHGPSLRGVHLSNADLRGAGLRGVDLSGAYMRHAVLRDAVLRDASLHSAVLSGAVLRRAVLRDADLRDAVLRYADLTDADLSGAVTAAGLIVRFDAGDDGGHFWHAYVTDAGATWLQYGCDDAMLDVWLERDASYGRRHGYGEDHWHIGPAVAIAAAVRLRDGGAA